MLLAFLWHFVPVYPHEKDLMAFHGRCRWYFRCSITGNVSIVSSAAAAAAVNRCLNSSGWRALHPRPSSLCCLTNEMQIMKLHEAKYHSVARAASWRCVFSAVFPPIVTSWNPFGRCRSVWLFVFQFFFSDRFAVSFHSLVAIWFASSDISEARNRQLVYVYFCPELNKFCLDLHVSELDSPTDLSRMWNFALS